MLSRSPALQSPRGYLEQKGKSVELLKNRLVSGQNQIISRYNQHFIGLTAKLDAMSPLKVLTRGYAMVQNEHDQVIRSVEQVELGERIEVSLQDGKLSATVMEKRGI